MKVDGLHSGGPLDRVPGKKPEPKVGGKSFADALGKAQAAGQPAAPAAAAAPAPESAPPPPMDSHIDTIRFRLQSGYYNSPKVDDALSDKLSGYFDDVA